MIVKRKRNLKIPITNISTFAQGKIKNETYACEICDNVSKRSERNANSQSTLFSTVPVLYIGKIGIILHVCMIIYIYINI